MSDPPSRKPRSRRRRPPLDRARVLTEAIALADEAGLPALSMRSLGRRLGVEAMSLYNHVKNKDDLLDGIVDRIVREIDLPTPDEPWREAMRRRALSAREVFRRHPWATGLMETRTRPGPASLRYYDAVLGCLRQGGFSVPGAAHAFSLLDSYLYGFSMQETSMPIQTPDQVEAVAGGIMESLPVDAFPHFSEMVVEHALKPGYDYGAEFEWGLDLILDGLERAR